MDERLKPPRPPGSYAQVRADEEEPLFGWTLDSVVCTLREFCGRRHPELGSAAPGDDARSGYHRVRQTRIETALQKDRWEKPGLPQWVFDLWLPHWQRGAPATATTLPSQRAPADARSPASQSDVAPDKTGRLFLPALSARTRRQPGYVGQQRHRLTSTREMGPSASITTARGSLLWERRGPVTSLA